MDNHWFTQKDICRILKISKSSVSEHITEIMNDYNIEISELPVVASDGKVYMCKHYDLEMLCNIAVKARNPEVVKQLLRGLGKLHPASFKFPAKEYRFKELMDKAMDDVADFFHQYEIDGYCVDFYFPLYRLVVEYDEHTHKYYKDEVERENKLMLSDLVCYIIRVKEGEELEGLNAVIKHITSHTRPMSELFPWVK